MLLRGRQGTELELELVDYQFPRERVDPWDSNSLLVRLRILAPQGSWEVLDPCLTTWEAEHLVRWLATLASQFEVVGGRLNEPNVSFSAQAVAGEPDRVELRTCFELELRPPWLGSGNLCVDVDVTRQDLARAALALRNDLDRFPQRGDDPTL